MPMRFIVFGSGAIGGVIGGSLFEHRYEVILVARGANYEALSAGGLRFSRPGAELVLPVPVVRAPSDIEYRDDDVLMLTVKGQDTLGAVRALADAAPSSLPIVCVQNGVENERVALRRFPSVYGAYLSCSAIHLRPGAVQARSAPLIGIIDLGRWPAGVDSTCEAIAASLSGAMFSSTVRPDIADWKWAKLLLNLTNAIDALCGPAGDTGDIKGLVLREALTCLEAAGIAAAREREDEQRSRLRPRKPTGGEREREGVGNSSWQSLARTTGHIESDYLNGEVVLLGRLVGVPTPLNAAIQRIANRAAAEGREPGCLSPGELRRLL
jgi:2-dehydropantoate 2-reductase